jgi:hypothetical protein
VQRLLKGDRMRRAVLHGEPQRQGLREDHGVDRAKRLRPERRADVTVAETEGQCQRLAAGGFDPVEMPRRGTRKAVVRCRRRVPVGAEPREGDRDAAADRPARRKSAVGATAVRSRSSIARIGCNAATKGAYKLARLGFRAKELFGGLDWWQ